MSAHQEIWKTWAARLHQWGLGEVTASILEATAPLNLVAAQLVYIGQPVLRGVLRTENLNALAIMLEDPRETHTFVSHLRENS